MRNSIFKVIVLFGNLSYTFSQNKFKGIQESNISNGVSECATTDKCIHFGKQLNKVDKNKSFTYISIHIVHS